MLLTDLPGLGGAIVFGAFNHETSPRSGRRTLGRPERSKPKATQLKLKMQGISALLINLDVEIPIILDHNIDHIIDYLHLADAALEHVKECQGKASTGSCFLLVIGDSHRLFQVPLGFSRKKGAWATSSSISGSSKSFSVFVRHFFVGVGRLGGCTAPRSSRAAARRRGAQRLARRRSRPR